MLDQKPGFLKLIGPPALRAAAGTRFDLPKKAYALALHLILDAPEMTLDREEIAKFLWPEPPTAQQLANLRPLLTRLRKVQQSAGMAPFTIDSRSVSLNLAEVECDLLSVMLVIRQGNCDEFVEIGEQLDGELLEGCDKGSASFEHWVHAARTELTAAFSERACKILAARSLAASPDKELALALRLMAVDPSEEESYRAQIRICAARGDNVAMRRAYARLTETLRADVGCEPSQETKDLLSALIRQNTLGARFPVSETSAMGAESTRTREASESFVEPILLVPNEIVGVGIRESGPFSHLLNDLIAQLWQQRVARIVVIDIASRRDLVQPLRGHPYRMAVSVHHGGRARISSRLDYVPSGDLLWAESFVLSTENYDGLVQRIASSILVKIEDHQIELSADTSELNQPTFVLIAQANRASAVADLPSIRRARRLFRTALQADDSQIRAIAGISRTLWLEWVLRAGQDVGLLHAGEEIARKAMERHPDNYWLYKELGMIAQFSRDPDLALKYLSRARELQPFEPNAIFDYCDALISSGDSRQAIGLLRSTKIVSIGHNDYRSWSAATGLYLTGQYKESIEEIKKMKFPAPAYKLRAANEALLGNREEANYFMRKAKEAVPDFSLSKWIDAGPFVSKVDIEHFYEGHREAGFQDA